MNNETFICHRSKVKLVLMALLSLGFTVYSVVLLLPNISEIHLSDVIKFIFIISVVFFGLSTLVIVRKIFNNEPALIIDARGIMNHTNAVGKHFIPWETIIEIEIIQIKSTRILLVFVNNPKEIIAQTKGFSKWLAYLNYKQYNTPLSITTSGTTCKMDQVISIIQNHVSQRKQEGSVDTSTI
jgi:hypothetical protein